jgi:hypothetical protein
MRESYQVIFNSQTSDIINKDNLAEVTYNINWGSFLPKKYRKFEMHYTMKTNHFSPISEGALGMLNINLGRMENYNGNEVSNDLGLIYPVNLSGNITGLGYYRTNIGAPPIIVNYPSNNQPTIRLNDFAGDYLSSVQNYICVLNFVGIEEESNPFLAGV